MPIDSEMSEHICQQLTVVQLHLGVSEQVPIQYNRAMRRLTTGIRSEKCVVRRLRRCAKFIECTYTNLDSTV